MSEYVNPGICPSSRMGRSLVPWMVSESVGDDDNSGKEDEGEVVEVEVEEEENDDDDDEGGAEAAVEVEAGGGSGGGGGRCAEIADVCCGCCVDGVKG